MLGYKDLLERQRFKRFRINSRKTEAMVCGKTSLERVNIVDISGGELTQVAKLKYPVSTPKEAGGCEAEIQDRVKAA